ncbi:hypothetical protein PC118_g17104 [Phytophthora cactorum]|uniref:Uncharacterized protein n=1 Tax=Phytophthora cactorum TaxID=29920 RepID=A0A8T1B7L2_9STRA|nr:hypothetical protein PC112_g17350 [Phytophthora cactorum]KAG2895817.1 hypothetical protein PC115_g17679 [Phytophthora cactorum]KAG2908000.1 hypothetical protein PC117_g20085 [Phytophthora cactorum]KAG2970047.1 hypothetical protein PC118_g17104 [Phytophthora cactorum]KAG3015342.1 hypothetical protein PC120_g12206 [Phytophthora cactorum]
MDSGDLYSGLELPKKTKREREEEAKSSNKAGDASAKDSVKRHRVDKKPLDLPAMVVKLEGFMLVSKKFAKASALFCQLMSDQLTAESSELFMKTLTKRDVLLRGEGDVRGERERKLNAWKFLTITHAQLFTDDTYQFNKAAKVVKLRFEEMQT